MTYKERLIKELEELVIKKDRLSKYIDSNPQEDTILEKQQEKIMNDYINILEQRILYLMCKEG